MNVDGRARLVTTEVFFLFVRFFACVVDRSCCVPFGLRYPFSKVESVSLQMNSQYPSVYGVQLKTCA